MPDKPETTAAPPLTDLQEISGECWLAMGQIIKQARMEDLRRFGGGTSLGIIDVIWNLVQGVLDRLDASYISWWIYNAVLYPALEVLNNVFLSPVQEILNSLPRSLTELISGPLSFLGNIIGWAIDNVVTPLWEIPGSIGGSIWNAIESFVMAPLTWINENLWRISDLPNTLWNAITGLVETVWNIPFEIAGTIGFLIDRFNEFISGGFNILGQTIGTPLRDLALQVINFFINLPGGIANGFLSMVTSAINFIVPLISGWWNGLVNTVEEIINRILPAGKRLISSLWAGLETIPQTFTTWISQVAGKDLAMNPVRALTTAFSAYGLAIAAGSGAHVISTALNLVPTLNWVGASQMAGLVSQVAAFEPITNATYGTLINDVLTMPLRYYWNNQFRPKLPTEGEIFTMGRKHGISYGEFKTSMGYMGIPDWWIEKMYDFFWTDPSPMWLLRMTEGGIPKISDPGRKRPWLDQWIPGWQNDPLAWLKMKLMLAGYEDIDIMPMIDGMRMRGQVSSTTQWKTSVRAMVRAGYWNEGDVRQALEPYGVREEEIHSIVLAEDLDYQKSYLDDEVNLYKESFRKGEISEQDLTLALSSIYVKTERVTQEVTRERIRALPKPKTVTPLERDPLITRLRTQAIDSWIKGYRAWEISQDDLLLGLTIVTQDRSLAEQMLATELTHRRPATAAPEAPAEDPLVSASRRQAIATWISAYRDGTIDDVLLETYLSALIPNETTRHQVVELEKLRYYPTPDLIAPAEEDPELAKIRSEFVRGHLEMFQSRLIGLDELYAYLLADGLVEPLSRATVITQASKRISPPAASSDYFLKDTMRDLIEQGLERYQELYLAGEITLAEYRGWISGLVEDPVVVLYLVDQVDLKRFVDSL